MKILTLITFLAVINPANAGKYILDEYTVPLDEDISIEELRTQSPSAISTPRIRVSPQYTIKQQINGKTVLMPTSPGTLTTPNWVNGKPLVWTK